MSGMELKRRLVRLLASDDIEIILAELAQLPPATVLNPLFAGIVHGNETIRWHAITAMGQTVATLAAANMETARVVMRRLMWSLNDESGGIGWGAPRNTPISWSRICGRTAISSNCPLCSAA